MSVTRQGRLRRAAALVPLALLSAAWTVSISTTGAPQASAGDRHTLPDGTVLPDEALQIPASVTVPDSNTLGVTGENSRQIVSASSASSIPSTALAAYQRAETVINQADPTCHLPWQLLAAIGRVESDHGRANGNQLTVAGVAQPGVFGKALDGQTGTSTIVDTDGGQYDGDTSFDRAVGPMQFIPSTWSTVGVDADGDGQRNPQDINDAALAAAVYLCSGTDDLAGSDGQSAAVYRYNHSSAYVATVLAVMQSYLAGDYTAAPNYTIPATYFEPDAGAGSGHAKAKHKKKARHHSTTSSTTHPTAPSSTAPAAPEHTSTDTKTPSLPTKPPKVSTPSDPVGAVASAAASALPQPVVDVLSQAEALTLCNQQLGAIPDPLGLLNGVKQACADKVAGKTQSAALAAIPNTLNGVLAWLRL
ncbi:Membrane-bound lytic murein transglycosylase B [Nocardioides terrae]|uniref:Membrane-bound lytic murein transglycosylase B n=1 Tax=Nocardioides terrae TaxID=574651 RepID=A0A1I1HCJ6_9ACTN|nr:lytic transglycosylase domain-containing protein [Nocardioides terrae]SFC21516.1 Membrane-bound lytic murein transglycosylase B [Nocardioides terrae]